MREVDRRTRVSRRVFLRGSAAAVPAAAVATAGLGVVLLLAAVKIALHLATTGLFGYGFFIDELYFLACSEHLSWGFVDMPPLFPAITALIRATLGDSLLAVRLLPALSGAALVLMTGLIARDLGDGGDDAPVHGGSGARPARAQ